VHAETDKATRTERYQAAIKRALEIAMNVSDDAMRDVAVAQIIALRVSGPHEDGTDIGPRHQVR
jgi:hypothetical protein